MTANGGENGSVRGNGHTLEITIQPGSGEAGIWPVVAEIWDSNHKLSTRKTGQLTLDLNTLSAEFLPLNYGIILGKGMFQDGIRDAVSTAMGRAVEHNDRLHLVLNVEDETLKKLHWQRLCYPYSGGYDFLAGNQNILLSQHLPTTSDRPFPPIGRRDLRALVLVAGASDLPGYQLEPFRVSTAIAQVKEALGDIPYEVLAGVPDAFGPPTLTALCKCLTDERFTLLHIVCHGRYIQDFNDTFLYFPGLDGKPVSGSQLVSQLRNIKGPHGLPYFVFLMSCEGAKPEEAASNGALGQRLVTELGIPAVLAMTDKITVDTAGCLAKDFYLHLREHGKVDQALAETLTPLRKRGDMTVPALFTRLSGQPLFSNTLDRPLTPKEIQDGLTRMRTLLEERAPSVIAWEFEPWEVIINDTLDNPNELQDAFSLKERQGALDALNSLANDTLEVTFPALALGAKVRSYDATCPFRGLEPFRTEDQVFFFGREMLVKRLVNQLVDSSFLTIVGESGSGKSSLVLAGLVPALREAGHTPFPFTPGAQPVAMLEKVLNEHSESNIFIVDQLEELFTQCHDAELVRTFARRLLNLLSAGKKVIVALREDFRRECSMIPELNKLIEQHTDIDPLSPEELRGAIEQQAGRVGLKFEAGLAQTIVNDVEKEPGAMPLSQYALLLLWKRRRGRWLKAQEYVNIGGVKEAIATSADALYKDFDENEKQCMRDIFLRLTRINQGEGAYQPDSRRRVDQSELFPAEKKPDQMQVVMSELVRSRLLITSTNELTGHDQVEVSHEALIRHWPRLQEWLKNDRENLLVRERIRDAALHWVQKGKKENQLNLRGEELEEAIRVSKREHTWLNALEQEYLDACIALRKLEEKRARQTSNLLRAILALVVIVLILVAAYTTWSANNADQSAKEARTSQRTAEAAVIAKVAALSTSDAALVDARSQRATAVASQLEANINRQKAEDEAKRAAEQQAIAEANAKVAADKVKIARARELADLASTHQTDDLILAYLLGIESYNLVPDYYTRNIMLSNLFYSPYLAHTLARAGVEDGVMEYSPDGSLLAVTEVGGRVRLVDGKNGATIEMLENPNALTISDLAFSPDGKILAAGGADGVTLWDTATRQSITTLGTMKSPQIAFKSNQELYAGVDSYEIQIWSVVTHNKITKTGIKVNDQITIMMVNAQGKLAFGTLKNGAYLERTLTPGYANLFSMEAGLGVIEMAFSADGSLLALMNDRDRTVDIWNTRDIIRIQKIQINMTGAQLAFDPTPKSKVLAYSAKDNTINRINADKNTPVNPPLKGHTTSIVGLAYGPGGRLASVSDEHFFLWDTGLPRSYAGPISNPVPVDSLAISTDMQTLLVGGRDKKIRLYGLHTNDEYASALGSKGLEPQEVFSYASIPTALAMSANGRLAIGSAGHLQIFAPDKEVGRKSVAGQDIAGTPNLLLFSPDGKQMVVGIRGAGAVLPSISVYEIDGWKKVKEFLPPAYHSLALSADGRVLYSSWEDEHVLVRDAESGQVLFDRHLTPETGKESSEREGIWTLLSPDGSYLHVYDTVSAQMTGFYIPTQIEVLRLPNWKVSPYQAVISQDGLVFLSVVEDAAGKTSLQLNLALQYQEDWLCDRTGRNLSAVEWMNFFKGEEYRPTCPQWP